MSIKYVLRFLRLAFLVLLATAPAALRAQQQVIPVWPGVAPGSENWTQHEVEYQSPQIGVMVRNVVHPTLTAFLPSRSTATGAAVIVCPGGGFLFLSWQNEGTAVARWLSQHGIAAFVLKYRLVNTGATEEEFRKAAAELFSEIARVQQQANSGTPPVLHLNAGNVPELAGEDGRQAIRVVRQRAAEWGIDPKRIGIMGFSAGGLVTDQVALHRDTASYADFAAPIYGAPFDKVDVPADAPPLFVLCANDDALSSSQSLRLFSEWKAAGKPAELHIYSKGGHGFGMAQRGLPVDHWIERFHDWMQVQGFLERAH